MRPLLLLYVSIACLASAVAIVWVGDPYARIFATLVAVLVLAQFGPALLIDLGMYLAASKKSYAGGRRLIEFAMELPTVFKVISDPMAVTCLSDIALLEGDYQGALDEALKAIDLSSAGAGWERKFFATSQLGAAYFALENWTKATQSLRLAWEIYGSGTDESGLRFLIDIKATVHADNLDMLAKMRLYEGDLAEAQSLFDRSVRVREAKLLKGSAHAYRMNVLGTFSLAKSDVTAATEQLLIAASMLPKRLQPNEHSIAIDILVNLMRIQSKRTDEVYGEIYDRFGPSLHVLHTDRLLLADMGHRLPNGAHVDADTTHNGIVSSILVTLEERISKRLPFGIAAVWRKKFRSKATKVDASVVWQNFIAWMLSDSEHGLAKYAPMPADIEAMDRISNLFVIGCLDRKQWLAASQNADQVAKKHRDEAINLKKSNHSSELNKLDDSIRTETLAAGAIGMAASAARVSIFGSGNAAASILDEYAGVFVRASVECETAKGSTREARESAYILMSEKLLELMD